MGDDDRPPSTWRMCRDSARNTKCSAPVVLVTVNVVVALITAALCAYGIFMVATEGSVCLDCLTVPIEVSWMLFGISLGLSLLALASVFAVRTQTLAWLYSVFLVCVFVFCATVALCAIAFIWGSDATTLTTSFTAATSSFKSYITNWALRDSANYVTVQNTMGCCGVDLYTVFSPAYDFQTALHTGQACNATIDNTLALLHMVVPTLDQFDPSVYPQLQAAIISLNGGKPYFCSDVLFQFTQGYGLAVGGVILFYALVQFAELVLLVVFVRQLRTQGATLQRTPHRQSNTAIINPAGDGGRPGVNRELSENMPTFDRVMHRFSGAAAEARSFVHRYSHGRRPAPPAANQTADYAAPVPPPPGLGFSEEFIPEPANGTSMMASNPLFAGGGGRAPPLPPPRESTSDGARDIV